MEVKQIQAEQKIIHIKGRNFHGQAELKGDTLLLEITQFKKANLYVSEITNLHLEKEPKRFLMFKKIEEIFFELRINRKLQVSDQNSLIIPVEIIYKNRLVELNIELLLAQRKLNNEAQKIQLLFDQIQNISNIVQINNVLIYFKGDKQNKMYEYFQQQGRKLRKVKLFQGKKKSYNSYQYNNTIFNHFKPVQKKDFCYFKIKIIIAQNKNMLIGVCGKNIKSQVDTQTYNSPYFMGLRLQDCQIFPAKKKLQELHIVEGSTIIKVEINTIQNLITWYQNDRFIHSAKISAQLQTIDFYPMITMCDVGDKVEFIDN